MAKMVQLGSKVVKGSVWDEGGKSDILQILISHQQDSINSVQFLYFSEGSGSLSEAHGELNGLKFNIVVIEHPLEYLTALSGEYSNGKLALIVFGTNKTNHGPFGRTSGGVKTGIEEFKYEFVPMCGIMQNCCFGGFHGSVLDGYVNSIGVYISPLEVVKPLDHFGDCFDDYPY